LTRPKQTLIVTPAPSAMARLQRLHATAAGLADDAPEIIAHPEAARSLEQALIQAMADCLATREGRKNTLAQGQHAIVMRRFRRVVEENPKEPLYIPEICKAIRVSPRALLLCCQEHLGMGPKRYAPGTAGPAPGNAWYDIGYGDCDARRFLAARSLCRQIPFPVRRVSVRHTARAIRPAAASVCGK
jgi:hypothetical protein